MGEELIRANMVVVFMGEWVLIKANTVVECMGVVLIRANTVVVMLS